MAQPFVIVFFDTYFNMFVNDANVLYLPETDYSQLTGVKELLIDYDSETGGSPKLNPDRKLFWTNIYFDEAVKKWMLSVSLPIDYNNQWIGCVGHDLLVEDSIKRSEEVSIPGSYNLVFSKKGDLVGSKNFRQKIEQSGGQLELNKLNDPQIKLIWDIVSQKQNIVDSFRSEEAQAFLGIQKIAGPDWILVQVYPFSLVMEKANVSIFTVVLITLLSLLIELYIIYRILNKEVAAPLSELVSTTTNIYEEPSIQEKSINRNDELGVLARSIKSMAAEVTENKNNLETKVKERTNELTVTNNLLLEKNINLDQLNKEKNEFLSIANHDLKNPLAIILLTTGLIRKKLDTNTKEKIVEKLDLVDNQAVKMLDIINAYLNYMLIEEKSALSNKAIFNFTELITLIINQNQVAINNKKLILNKQLENEVMISSSKSFCGIIFENLLSNAIKFTAPNKEIKIELYQEPNSIFLRISDEGLGIPKEEQHLIFGKFVKLSTKPTGGENSSGLGLSIVKQLVDRIGAKISFESSPLLGTQFLVEFPKEQD
jgi:signal transduction histidine kinase